MAENKASKAAGEAQEPPKTEKAYKVTCGTFKARNEAFSGGMTKAEAEAAKKAIEAKKVKAEVSEQ